MSTGSRRTSSRPTIPLNGESRYKREARRIYRNVAEVLAEAGAGFSDVVRVDQYYTAQRAMHPYHEVRHEVFWLEDSAFDVEPASAAFAHRTDDRDSDHGRRARRGLSGPSTRPFKSKLQHPQVSGYSPALSAGDFRFVPGQTAEALQRTTDRCDRSRGARPARALAQVADQARNRLHHHQRSCMPSLKAVARASTAW